MTEVVFTAQQKWALLPERPKVDRAGPRAERDLYAEHFRYKRVVRLAQDCPPWVMGQELGWLVRSPVTITVAPLDDIEFGVPSGEDPADAARRLGLTGKTFGHDPGFIGARDTARWIYQYDFASGSGWQSMFNLNGSGSVEWRQGWSVTIPDRYFLMVIAAGCDVLDIPVGVMPAKAVNAMTDPGGMAIAAHPLRHATIARGEPIARLILLHPDSLQAKGGA